MKKNSKTRKPNTSAKPTSEYKSTAVLPYIKGLSEQLHFCLQRENIRAHSSHLVRPKDANEPAEQDGVWFTGFPVNAVNSTSARLGHLYKTESKNMSETPACPYPDRRRFRTREHHRTQLALEQSKVY